MRSHVLWRGWSRNNISLACIAYVLSWRGCTYLLSSPPFHYSLQHIYKVLRPLSNQQPWSNWENDAVTWKVANELIKCTMKTHLLVSASAFPPACPVIRGRSNGRRWLFPIVLPSSNIFRSLSTASDQLVSLRLPSASERFQIHYLPTSVVQWPSSNIPNPLRSSFWHCLVYLPLRWWSSTIYI